MITSELLAPTQEHVRLQLTADQDAAWLASFGIEATDEVLTQLQSCIDADTDD